MRNDKKFESDNHSSVLDEGESLLERYMKLVVNWVLALVALIAAILCMPLFCFVDLYRWFKFKVFSKK